MLHIILVIIGAIWIIGAFILLWASFDQLEANDDLAAQTLNHVANQSVWDKLWVLLLLVFVCAFWPIAIPIHMITEKGE